MDTLIQSRNLQTPYREDTHIFSQSAERPSLLEPIQHGTALFPLALYEVSSAVWMEERIWCHWHEELELLVVTRGTAQMHIFDHTFSLREGSIVIVPPGSLHSASQTVGKPFSFFAVVFSLSFLDSLLPDALRQKYFAPFFDRRLLFPELIQPEKAWQHQLLTLMFSLRDLLADKEKGFELLVKARLYEIWYVLSSHCPMPADFPADSAAEKAQRIKPILLYLQTHYNQHLTLKELSETFHMSEGYFCRFFKSMTKMSPTDYLNYYRISISTQLLSQHRYSISEIAGMTGFNNISYFNKIFRRYMHMTPSQFLRSTLPA